MRFLVMAAFDGCEDEFDFCAESNDAREALRDAEGRQRWAGPRWRFFVWDQHAQEEVGP